MSNPPRTDDDYWNMLAWDDEEHAEPPYVQIYSDVGCIAALYYTMPDEHEQALEFARRLMALKSDADAGEALKVAVIDALRSHPEDHGERLWTAVEQYQAATGQDAP